MRPISIGALALAGLTAAGAAVAQESRGTISGRVTDVTGAVLVGASVTAVNADTNATSAATTSAKGQFTILFLVPGSYSVTVEQSGFRKTVRPAVVVRVGDKAQIDFSLEPGGATEEVSVVAERPLLDAGTGSLGQLVDSTLITELPLGDGTATNNTIFRNNQLDLGPRNANFGKYNNSGQPTVVMYPRDIQVGARLTF